MINQVIIVGRIKAITGWGFTAEVQVPEGDKKYHPQIIPVFVVPSMMNNVLDYLKPQDVVGVKGCLDSRNGNLILRAEKLSFLASKKEDE